MPDASRCEAGTSVRPAHLRRKLHASLDEIKSVRDHGAANSHQPPFPTPAAHQTAHSADHHQYPTALPRRDQCFLCGFTIFSFANVVELLSVVAMPDDRLSAVQVCMLRDSWKFMFFSAVVVTLFIII